MGKSHVVKIVALMEEVPALVLETAWVPGSASQQHRLPLLAAEVESFKRVLALRPFGAGAYQFAIDSLSEIGESHACRVRLSREGSRERQEFPISKETHGELSSVFGSNIVSPGYVRI